MPRPAFLHRQGFSSPGASGGGGGGGSGGQLSVSTVGGTTQLSTGGARVVLNGVTVWGIPGNGGTWNFGGTNGLAGTGFGSLQYQNRNTIVSTAKSWGANCIRLGIFAADYEAGPGASTGSGLTPQQYIQVIQDWYTVCSNQNMWLMPCDWTALNLGASWTSADMTLWTAIISQLGNAPWLICEPFNEPNNIGWPQWQTNFQTAHTSLRGSGFTGLIVDDPISWANSGTGAAGYDNTNYNTIEAFDAARLGTQQHQMAFAKHDYANDGYNGTWSTPSWQSSSGIPQTSHLIFETEIGNYNGSPASVSTSWSAAAATALINMPLSIPNYVGTVFFLYGPWADLNAITSSDDITPTNPWGLDVMGALEAAPVAFPPGPIGPPVIS